MKIIAFANSKGGVNKTAACLSVGCCLAEMGSKVLMIDLDHQANLSDDFNRGDEDYTISDIYENPKFDPNKLIVPALDGDTPIEGLDIIPSDITLAIAARSAERFTHRLLILSDAIKKIKNKYDYILLDLRPAIDLTVENALLISDLLVVPVNMDKRAVKGIDDLLEVTEEVKRSGDFRRIIVRTSVNKSATKMMNTVNELLAEKGYPVAETVIGVSELYKQATEVGRPVVLFAPDSKPHQDYRQLTEELIGVVVDG